MMNEENDNFIFIKDEPENINDLFVDENWKLSKLYSHIYIINVKDVNIPWLVKTYSKPKYAKKERKNLFKLRDVSNIPRVLCSGVSETFSYNMISKIPGIDLYEHVQKYGFMKEKEVCIIAKQLLTIIQDVHSKNIIHRDIKPENIIYDKKTKTVSLIDFEEKYTEDFQSPEQVIDRQITKKTDIWSIGITIFFLAKGKLPFRGERQILKKNIRYPKAWSDSFKDFLSILIEKNTKIRYSAKEALQHSWIVNNL